MGLKAGPNLYLYVGLNPLRFIDPLGLTRQDIDALTDMARINNPDLKLPDTVDTMSMADGGLGFTNPFSLGRGVYVNRKFLEILDCLQILDLYEIIIHESIHRTRSRWDSIWRPLNHPDIYDDARRRAAQQRLDVLKYCEECTTH